MQTRLAKMLLLLTLSVAGCRQSAESKRQAELERFNKQMDTLMRPSTAMARSDVISMLGQPNIGSETNCGPNNNWLADNYRYHPHVLGFKLITNGYTFVYSNDV